MGVTAIKVFLVFLIFFNGTITCLAQDGPISSFDIIMSDKATGKGMDLVEWLEHDVATPTEFPCSPTFGFFSFKVTGAGKVDSIAFEGNLESRMSEKIVDNISKTEGHWKIPANASKKASQWFFFPYFDFGKEPYRISKCSEAEKMQQKMLIEISQALQKTFYVAYGKGVKIIGVSQNRGPFIKM